MKSARKLVIGILAHVDSGKTTLSESILYRAGVIRTLGRVDLKNTYLDTDSVEKERGITIYSKDARFDIDGCSITLIDTPGHVDFSPEAERVLPVLDLAVLLISGSSGVQSHTRTLWSLLKSYKIPTMIFVNKMDMPGCDKDRLLKDISAKLSDNAVDHSDAGSSEYYENIATCNDALLDTYLSTGSIPEEDIYKAVSSRLLFPVYFGSALKGEGTDELLSGIAGYCNAVSFCDADAPFGGIVYKISRDESGRRLTHLKITSGRLNIKDMLGDEKINDIRLYSGNRFSNVVFAEAGDICVLAGINSTKAGDIFGKAQKPLPPLLAPAISYAVSYPDDLDKSKVLNVFKLLEEEDPSLCLEYREQTGEIFVSLMGDIQAQILKRTLADRFGMSVSFTDGKVCYKETVTRSVEGVGHFEPLRHYAEVHIRIEPLERGSGLQFESDIPEDILARNWQRLIYTHMCEKNHRGVLMGCPLTDVKLSLVSGRAHIKHTEGGDFRQATYRAIRQGLMELREIGACRLLEPYYSYSLTLPNEYVGRAMTDINQMSGTADISENDYNNNITVLTGRAPVSAMNGYANDVTAYSKGLGKLSLTLCGYDDCRNEEEVLAANTYDPDSDLRNPSSSVICSHGAGTVISWSDIPEYMHISYASPAGAFADSDDREIYDISERLSQEDALQANRERRRRERENDLSIGTDEIDAIIRSTSHANENGRSGSYKGISASHKNHVTDVSRKPAVYRGAPIKPKYILIDGYNVIHAWKELNDLAESGIDCAAGRLNDILCNYRAITGIPLMVVYDAYRVKGHSTEEKPYNNITVVYTKEAQTADQYIERYAHENSGKYDITVVTSDGLEQIIVSGNGGLIMSSREFEREVLDKTSRFNAEHNVK